MSEFTDYLKELFAEFGIVSARKMFGGYGIYHDGVMFGLVDDDTLYLKSDETTQAYYESKGLPRFKYQKGGKAVTMSYYRAPDEIFDDPEEAALWAKRAFQVAFLSKQRAGKKGGRGRK